MTARPELAVLAQELRADLERIASMVAKTQRVLDALGDGTPDEVQLAAISSYLHGFYNGVENVLQRVVRQLDGAEPAGPWWHSELLSRAGLDVEAVRPPVLREGTIKALRDYLAFRHFIRHAYGVELFWERFASKALGLPDVFDSFRTDIEMFVSFLLDLAGGHAS